MGPLIAALVLAVVVAAGWFLGPFGGSEAEPPVAAPETGRPSSAPPAESAARPTLDAPFRGSPAARWESGAAGITVPKAEATGWMDVAEVRRALDRSLTFLTETNLDADVLRGARPEKTPKLVNPHQEDVQTFLRTAFREPGPENDPLLLASRFDTARTHLVGDEVRTRGGSPTARGSGARWRSPPTSPSSTRWYGRRAPATRSCAPSSAARPS